jgi:hypothetical protein
MKLKYIQLIFIASCFFYLSCQPSGGDFIPVLSDGVVLKPMFSKEESALQFNDAKFSIKVAGDGWRIRNDGGSFWIVIKNNNADKLIISFDKIRLKNSLEQTLGHSSAIQLKRDEPAIPEQKTVSIVKGETQAYNISFGDTNKTEQIEKREKYLGQTISLTIPVKIDLEDKSYEFQFTYGDYLPEGEYNETLID